MVKRSQYSIRQWILIIAVLIVVAGFLIRLLTRSGG